MRTVSNIKAMSRKYQLSRFASTPHVLFFRYHQGDCVFGSGSKSRTVSYDTVLRQASLRTGCFLFGPSSLFYYLIATLPKCSFFNRRNSKDWDSIELIVCTGADHLMPRRGFDTIEEQRQTIAYSTSSTYHQLTTMHD